ncbi:MAG: hypothetical protein ABI127_00135 [Dokdonella sp.]
MNSSDLPILPEMATEIPGASAAASPAELGDVIDSIEDAAATLSRVVRGEAQSMVEDVRSLIREQPIVAVSVVGAVAYLFGRLMR